MAHHLSAELRRLVVRRARNHCEYCGLSQEGQEATFHIDHVIPVSDGGPDTADNLALACVSCSLARQHVKLPWIQQAANGSPLTQGEMPDTCVDTCVRPRDCYNDIARHQRAVTTEHS